MSKSKCCQKWKKEGKFCKDCPLRKTGLSSPLELKIKKKKKKKKKKTDN